MMCRRVTLNIWRWHSPAIVISIDDRAKDQDQNLPIIVKGPAPNAEVQDLHRNVRQHNIRKENLDRNVLSSQRGEAQIHDQQAQLCAPDCYHLAVLHDQNELASESALCNIRVGHMRDVVAGWEKV